MPKVDVYDLKGVFLAHWKNDKAYDEHGKVIMSRSNIK